MTRTPLSHARLRRALWQGGLGAALALGLVAGSASPAAAAGAEPAIETVYRFPFDPETTTPDGGEFASEVANGTKRKAPHRGHDFSFGAALGVPIPAIADGIVRAKSSDGPLGNCVALEHADGAFSAYCHMAAPTPLQLGESVEIGDAVGGVGGTPKVPVHLHLTMGWSVDAMAGIGTFDPIPYIAARLAAPQEAEPEAESETAERGTPAEDPRHGVAVTHSIPTAV
ncbi:M23 family metallopeptidase [Lysobacter korlensis]|uniref:M23 family metallopeptidase n=1 Tax=Lysobacter korlensis TaxID=553636 RepID=A0ABV6RVP4_9GAMM